MKLSEKGSKRSSSASRSEELALHSLLFVSEAMMSYCTWAVETKARFPVFSNESHHLELPGTEMPIDFPSPAQAVQNQLRNMRAAAFLSAAASLFVEMCSSQRML